MSINVDSARSLVVTTESGSRYIFENRAGHIAYRKGFSEGIDVKFLNDISIGERLKFSSRDYDPYDNLSEEAVITETSRVIRVDVLG